MHGFLVDGHIYTYAMMHGELDLHYPAWRYAGMRENPSLGHGMVSQTHRSSHSMREGNDFFFSSKPTH